MPKYERKADRFARQLDQRNLPIDPYDAKEFAQELLAKKPPRGFLDRLLPNFQYLDRRTFNNDLDRLASMATETQAGRPYAVILTNPEKSDWWIYEQLVGKGMPRAAAYYDDAAYDAYQEELADEWEKINKMNLTYVEKIQFWKKLPGGKNRWLKTIPEDIPIYTFDDFAISGANIKGMLVGMSDGTPIKPSRDTLAFFCYGSKKAINYLTRYFITTNQSGGGIATLDENMTEQDLHFMDREVKKAQDYPSGMGKEDSVLFWAWHKVPDNMPEIFKGEGFSPLIRPERFQPPYKQRIQD